MTIKDIEREALIDAVIKCVKEHTICESCGDISMSIIKEDLLKEKLKVLIMVI
jgi:ssDNA-binding replication factor A large subunit